MDDLFFRFRDFIHVHRMVQPGEIVLLSLSAGKDSMAMMDLFLRFRDECRLELFGFHLNHMMRGDASREDEIFVAEQLAKYGIPCRCDRFDFSAGIPGGVSFEDYARRVRYTILSEYAAETGAAKIATAHNRDDAVETVFMRICQGTGISGLAGIRPMRDNIVRPLLDFSSQQIYGYLKFRGLSWREDASNRENVYVRNYVRNTAIPGLEERFPRLRDAVHSLSDVAADTVTLIDDLICLQYGNMWTRDEEGNIILEAERYLRDRRLLFHVINRAFGELGVFTGTGILREIWKRTGTGRTHEVLYESRDISARKTMLGSVPVIILAKKAPPEATGDWEYGITLDRDDILIDLREPGITVRLFFAAYEFFEGKYRDNSFIFVDAGDKVDYIVIRNRRKGDRITLDGLSRRIKKLLIEMKMSPGDKDRVPLLVVDSEIAACMPGFIADFSNRTGDRHKVLERGKKILAIQVIGK